MKYTPYITILAVLLATACAKEEIIGEQQPVLPENAVRFSGLLGQEGQADAAPGTRTSYEDVDNSIKVLWTDTDEIGVFCEAGEVLAASNYGYRNAVAGATASFSAIDADKVITWNNGETHDFYAYYPYSGGDISPEAVPVTLPAEQSSDAADPDAGLAAWDFMYAVSEGVTSASDGRLDEPVALKFSHLFAVVDVKITASLTAVVDELVFSCTDEAEALAVGDGSSVNIRTGAISVQNPSNAVTLTGSRNVMPGSATSFRFLVNPGHADKEFTITAKINGKDYPVATKTAPSAGLEAGKVYHVTPEQLTIAPEDALTVNLSANGTANTYIVSYPATTYTFDATVKGNGVERSFTWSESDGTEITRGYTSADLEIAPASVGLVWYNTPKTADGYVNVSPVTLESVSYNPETGMASFTTPAGFVVGNVLIAAYDAKGTVLWSWNIWAAGESYDADAASRPVANGYVMMDRNLGAAAGPEVMGTSDEAKAIGNYYQWGRKDPFPAAAEYVSVSGVTGGDRSWGLPAHTPVEAFRQPADKQTLGFTDLIFGTDNASNGRVLSSVLGDSFTVDQAVEEAVRYPYRWMFWSGTDSGNDNYNWTRSNLSGTENAKAWKYLWGNPATDPQEGDSDNVKTIYDPCPPGWKVMPRAAWSFSDLNDVSGWHGYYSSSMDIYVPDSGQRQAGFGGSLIGSIDNGTAFISVANVSDSFPYRTEYGSTTSYNSYTGAGWNVRCVKENEGIVVPEPEPEPEASTYLLRGHVFGWGNVGGSGLTMYVDGDFVSVKDIDRESLIAENIGTEGFKVYDSATGTWLGVIGSTVKPGQPVEMSVSGVNGTLDTGSATSEKYDVYFRPGDNILYLMEAGQTPPEE